MNRILKSTLLRCLVATSLVGINVVTLKPASAENNQIRDIGIGAGTSAVTGELTGNHHAGANAINGAAAGAVVHQLKRGNCNAKGRHLVRDVAVGAGTSTVVGLITNRRNTLGNAANGAAVGAVVNQVGC